MSGNSSSSTNDTVRHPQDVFPVNCIANTLLVPLCTFILYLGLQRWRQQRSATTATTSHSDVFTYHMVIMELLGVLGCILSFYEFVIGDVLWSLTFYGQNFFHILTCFERYLAVVHPITYMKLRGERGIRIRDIGIGCAWLLSIALACLLSFKSLNVVVDSCLMTSSLIIVSFCCLSVLCVLILPGPGEQGGSRERVDQSKQRAFYTITAILVVLLLRCACGIAWSVLDLLGREATLLRMAEVWLYLPSSLVLPVLFLHRAGKCDFCQSNSK